MREFILDHALVIFPPIVVLLVLALAAYICSVIERRAFNSGYRFGKRLVADHGKQMAQRMAVHYNVGDPSFYRGIQRAVQEG